MRKKIVTAVIASLASVACACGLAACGGGNEHSHNFSIFIEEPTCHKNGYKLYTCDCGWTYREVLRMPDDHVFGDDKYDNNATCISDGTESIRCEICQYVKDRRVVVGSATGVHSYEGYVCKWCDALDPQAQETTLLKYTEIYKNNEVVAYGITYSGLVLDERYVQIPAEHNGKPVTTIFENAFEGHSKLIYIIIPDSVTVIGDKAFYDCDNIKSIEIPDSVKSIGAQAFQYCSSLTSVTIGSSVASIGDHAFSLCSSLTGVVIPNSVTHMGYSAFSYCDGLTLYCEAVKVPSDWGDRWNYSNCPIVWNCKNNNKDQDGYEYAVIDGIRYSLKNGIATVVGQPSNISRTIAIPSSVVYKNETYSVTGIAKEAFDNIQKLSSIVIPNSVISIGSSAFRSCRNLTSIDIPNSVTSIGDDTFNGCSSLTSVEMSNSVTSIGERAFRDCSKLTSIIFDGTAEEWDAISKGLMWDYDTGKYTVTFSDGKT